jgi:hypothetical protein
MTTVTMSMILMGLRLSIFSHSDARGGRIRRYEWR